MSYREEFRLLPRKCQHPVRIPDVTRPGHYMFVPCGHCAACVHNRRSVWINRLTDEQHSSAATLFFTLTYSNSHVPLATVSDDRRFVRVFEPSRCTVSGHSVSHINFTDQVDYAHVSHIQNSSLFAFCSKSDVQKFLKRLRRRLETDTLHLIPTASFRDRSFRYFICSEYGPHTYRPHYHGLLFFASAEVAAAAKVYLPACWQLCSRRNVDVSEVTSSAASYVAKYVNCDSHLPSVLMHKAFSPFYLFSRSPSLGSRIMSDEDIVSSVQTHHLQAYKSFVSDNGISTSQVACSRYSLSRLFPKPLQFYNLDRARILQMLGTISQCGRQGFTLVRCSDVAKRYGVGTYNFFGHKLTWSDVLPDINNDLDYCFGVPQNRHFAKCFLDSGLSPDMYCDLLFSLYSQLSSIGLGSQVDSWNYMVSQGYSVLFLLPLFYPSFVSTLPDYLPDASASDKCYFELILNSFDLTLCDVYSDDLHLLPFIKHCDYDHVPLYVDYLAYVSESKLKFDKTRDINHFININNNNYESF